MILGIDLFVVPSRLLLLHDVLVVPFHVLLLAIGKDVEGRISVVLQGGYVVGPRSIDIGFKTSKPDLLVVLARDSDPCSETPPRLLLDSYIVLFAACLIRTRHRDLRRLQGFRGLHFRRSLGQIEQREGGC